MKAYGKSWSYNVYDCQYCSFWKGRKKGCVYSLHSCCCPVPQKPSFRFGIPIQYCEPTPAAFSKSECDGCPYGRDSPCIGWCTKEVIISSALRRLENQVNNPYFSQWIDALVLAQDDRSIRHVAVSVVDSMHDVLAAQEESDAVMYAVWREYLLTMVLIFSVPLVFKVLMADAYVTMTTSLAGQSLMVLLLIAIVYSVFRALKINKPLMM